MTDRPWRTPGPVPRAIRDTPGQTETGERLLYYWLAREKYTGAGEIVEIGSLVGASSLCFAAGVVDNTRAFPKAGRIHAFDRFVGDDRTHPFLRTFYPDDRIAMGADFSHIYRRNIAGAASLIHVTKCDAYDLRWSGKPIEFLFIDCAISARLYDHLIAEFFPHLIPGRSIVIDQDFFFEEAPWLPVTAERLNMVPILTEETTLVSECGPDTISRISEVLGKFDSCSLMENIEALRNHARKYSPEQAQLLAVQEARMLMYGGFRAAGVAKARGVLAQSVAESVTSRATRILKKAGET